jgi:hypothetical protein
MRDTPKYVLQKQFEIIHAKPLKERIKGIFEMTELSRKIIQNQIQSKRPELSEIELKVELFKAFYRSDFNAETLSLIARKMKHFLVYEKKKNSYKSFKRG